MTTIQTCKQKPPVQEEPAKLSSDELAEVMAYQDFIEEGIIDSPLFYEKDLMKFLKEEERWIYY